jgi:hypothetical protein
VSSTPQDFAAHARLVRTGGTALTTRSVADPALLPPCVKAVNFALKASTALLDQLAAAATKGDLSVPVDAELPLEMAPRALARNRAGVRAARRSSPCDSGMIRTRGCPEPRGTVDGRGGRRAGNGRGRLPGVRGCGCGARGCGAHGRGPRGRIRKNYPQAVDNIYGSVGRPVCTK